MAISNFVSRCLNGEPPVVYGDGTQTRDFTFIEDVVEANVTLLSENAADGEALNIGSTDNIEILTLAEEIRDQLAPELEIEFAERHDADAEHTHADSSKASELHDDVACGTSYHAALYGTELLRDAGVQANAYLASEFAPSPAPITEDTLVVGVTQSGETADTLSALREARERGAETLALTNVVGSTAARECDHVVYIRSGPEIGVAATKTFSSQLVATNLLVEHLVSGGSRTDDRRDLIKALRALPSEL